MVSNIDNAQAWEHTQNMFDNLRSQLTQIIDKHKVANKWLTVEINVSIYGSTRCPDRSDLHNLLTT